MSVTALKITQKLVCVITTSCSAYERLESLEFGIRPHKLRCRYFKLVIRNARDAVPKAVGFFLVRRMKGSNVICLINSSFSGLGSWKFRNTHFRYFEYSDCNSVLNFVFRTKSLSTTQEIRGSLGKVTVDAELAAEVRKLQEILQFELYNQLASADKMFRRKTRLCRIIFHEELRKLRWNARTDRLVVTIH